jgi:hypothetical protein
VKEIAVMADSGEVTVERGGKQYGATYAVRNGMVDVKTHTETRSVELSPDQAPEAIARRVLNEILNAQRDIPH